jgi:hypothetical protein
MLAGIRKTYTCFAFRGEPMKVPNYVYFLVIPIFAGAISPVIAQFYPTSVYFWSALVVAILGAIVSAIAAIKQVQAPAPTIDTGVPGVTAASAPMPQAKQRGFIGRMFVGA